MQGLLTIAHLTWLEARRRRIVLAALICGIGFVVVYAIAVYFMNRSFSTAGLQRQLQLQLLTLVGLYAVNFLVAALAVMLPVDTPSGEMASGVMQTIASKPVRRAEIVLGKWLVYGLMNAGYIVIMAGGVVLVMRVITGFAQQRIAGAFGLMVLEATVLLSITIVGGVRFSTVTNGIVAFALYGVAFIGGWIEQVGVVVGNATARYIGTAISLVSPPDAMWRLAVYALPPPFMRTVQLGPFSPASVPSSAMVWWAMGYIIVALALAIRGFQKRAL